MSTHEGHPPRGAHACDGCIFELPLATLEAAVPLPADNAASVPFRLAPCAERPFRFRSTVAQLRVEPLDASVTWTVGALAIDAEPRMKGAASSTLSGAVRSRAVRPGPRFDPPEPLPRSHEILSAALTANGCGARSAAELRPLLDRSVAPRTFDGIAAGGPAPTLPCSAELLTSRGRFELTLFPAGGSFRGPGAKEFTRFASDPLAAAVRP